ncbi:MAG: hypothetical protein RR051_04475, partial [Clostridiales bacterium]
GNCGAILLTTPFDATGLGNTDAEIATAGAPRRRRSRTTMLWLFTAGILPETRTEVTAICRKEKTHYNHLIIFLAKLIGED